MTTPPWTGQPALVTLITKLQELTARIARLEALHQAQRTHTVVRAFQDTARSP